ncbi:hypothetical protein DFJ74DRAFT_357150, partial [Hyaloraphidium curvatum]
PLQISSPNPTLCLPPCAAEVAPSSPPPPAAPPPLQPPATPPPSRSGRARPRRSPRASAAPRSTAPGGRGCPAAGPGFRKGEGADGAVGCAGRKTRGGTGGGSGGGGGTWTRMTGRVAVCGRKRRRRRRRMRRSGMRWRKAGKGTTGSAPWARARFPALWLRTTWRFLRRMLLPIIVPLHLRIPSATTAGRPTRTAPPAAPTSSSPRSSSPRRASARWHGGERAPARNARHGMLRNRLGPGRREVCRD